MSSSQQPVPATRTVILATVGMPCSGKSIVARIAEELFSFRIHSFRRVVEEKLEEEGFGIADPLDMTRGATVLRERFGPDVFARRMVEKIRTASSLSSLERRVFIEGLRTPDEINCLRKAFPDIIIIGVIASQSTRVRRAVKRNRWDDPKFEDEILRKDAQEAAWGVGEALKIADVTLENDGNSIDELKGKVAKLIEGLLWMQKERNTPPPLSSSEA